MFIKRATFLNLLLIGSFLLTLSCKRESVFDDEFDPRLNKETTSFWDFLTSSNYNFNSSYVEVSGGSATLKTVDQTFSGTDFNSGTHVGTYVNSSNNIEVQSSSYAELDSSWTPQYLNLIDYWRLNGIGSINNSDTVAATVGVNGVVDDGADGSMSYVQGRLSEAPYFDGDDDVITFSSVVDADSYTVSVWVKADSFSNIGPRIITTNSFNIYVIQATNRVRFLGLFDSVNGIWDSPNNSISVGEWTHIAVTYDHSSVNSDPLIYIDGVAQVVTESVTPIGNPITNIGAGNIGNASGRTRGWHGELDELAYWGASLSSSEVQAVYDRQVVKYADHNELNSSWTPKFSSIIGYWKMDGNWQDSSGNGNHGTAFGGANFDADSKVGSQSSVFDGVGDYVQVSDSVSLRITGSHTVSFWLNIKNYPGAIDSRVFSHRGGSGGLDGYDAYISPAGNLEYFIGDGVNLSQIATLLPIPLSEWTHISLTYSSSTSLQNIYINGALDRSISIGFGGPLGANADLFLGTFSATVDRFLDGNTDELAIWNVTLQSDEVKELYNRQKQKYAGHYESPIIDLGTSGSWTNLDAITTLPFMKELTNTSESSSDYSSLSGDLSSGLIGYWPLNEVLANSVGGDDFEDRSNSSNNGQETSVLSYGQTGILDKAVMLSGGSITIGSSNSYISVNNQNFSFSTWFNASTIANAGTIGNRFISIHRGSTARSSFAVGVGSSDKIKFYNFGDVSTTSLVRTIQKNKWYHFIITYNGTCFQSYLNGQAIDSCFIKPLQAGGSYLAEIAGFNGSFELFQGLMDDVAIWNRALTANETQQLYRRGANRIKYQVKSCVDSSCNCKSFNTAPVGSATDCDGDGILNTVDTSDSYMAEFMGPGGNGSTSYSELFNRAPGDITTTCTLNTTDSDNDICMDDEITLAGDTNATSPSFTFSNMAASAVPTNNRYFQYKVLMEAEENTACSGEVCMPELTSIEVGPTGRYYGGSPVISPTSPISYNDITNIIFTETGSCSLTYQLSPDGSTYYYHNGTSWVTAGSESVALSTSASSVSSNITNFRATAGAGNLYWKAFMTSDTTQSCSLDQINVVKPN